MTISRVSGRSLRFGALAAMTALGVATPLTLAQTPMADMASAAHPAHIHTGTCEELGEVAIPLDELTMPADGETMGAESALPIVMSRTVVDVPFEEIVSGGHAINVHESADAIDVYVACGDIGGMVQEDENGEAGLVIGLRELNESGYSGVAWLGAIEDSTEVVVTLIQNDPMAGMDN